MLVRQKVLCGRIFVFQIQAELVNSELLFAPFEFLLRNAVKKSVAVVQPRAQCSRILKLAYKAVYLPPGRATLE